MKATISPVSQTARFYFGPQICVVELLRIKNNNALLDIGDRKSMWFHEGVDFKILSVNS